MAKSLIFGAVLLSAVACNREPERPQSPYRGAILITIDTARADHYSAYGYGKPTSPRLDALAQRGALFERAVVPIPRTTQSLASLMTGLAPAMHGVRGLYETLDPNLDTLAERLSDAGYKTGAIVEVPFFRTVDNRPQNLGLDQGFAKRFFTDPTSGEWRAADITDHALKWLTKNKDQRFFLWIHYRDPHAPYWPPQPFTNQFDSNYKEPYDGPLPEYFHYWPVNERFEMVIPQGKSKADLELEKEKMKFGKSEHLTARFVERATALYDGEIAYTDAQIGRLLDGLAPLGLADDVVTVITADHGESLGEHDFYFDHGEFLYDTCLRVPLVIHAPGYSSVRVNDLVGTIDVAPTILELLAASPLVDIQGRSLVPYLRNEKLPRREYYAESGEPLFPEGNPRFAGNLALSERDPEMRQRSFLTGWFKLIQDPVTDKVEVFDCETDPGETNDLSTESRIADRFGPALKVLEVMRQYDSGVATDELSDEQIEILRQNGYLKGPRIPKKRKPRKRSGSDRDDARATRSDDN
jgi:arylsulfatase A-like enzyme